MVVIGKRSGNLVTAFIARRDVILNALERDKCKNPWRYAHP
jgi:hypothetical protein